MSWQAVTWVLEQSQSVLGARLVLISIASHADRLGHNAWPSVDTLCLEARLTRREVQYCLRWLESKGELQTHVGGGRGRSSHYSIPGVETWLNAKNETAQNLRPLENPQAGKERNQEHKRRNLRQETAQPSAHERFSTVEDKPSSEIPKENLSTLVEPSENLPADLQASHTRLLIKSLGRKIKPTPPKSWEEQKAELRAKGLLA